MPYKNPEDKLKHNRKYFKLWYERGGKQRNRSADYEECILEWQVEHPDRVKVKQTLEYAVKKGVVRKPTICEECGRETRLSGHHEDYSKPLEVVWLCSSCHKLRHPVNT